MQILRDYQVDGVNEIRNRVRSGYRRILRVLPTGGGKTSEAAHIIDSARARGSKIVFLAHRRELIDQASARLDGLGVDHGIIMADHPRAKPWLPVQVGSIQTVHRRGLPWEPDLVFVDECHRIKGASYQQVIADCGRAVVIGITATPCRSDGKGLNPPFETMVIGPSLAELTARGYLVPARTYARKKPDLRGVSTTAGDYQQDELQEAMNKPEIVGDVVKEWQKNAAGRLTVVFAVGVKHSIALRDAFRATGVTAEHLDGETPKAERERLLADLTAGRITVLCNCGVLSEGWDCPPVSCVCIVRPTMSLVLYLQMAGRTLRTSSGKVDSIINDHGGCVYRHGLITAEREWTLDGEKSRPKGKRTKDVADCVKVCPDCDRVAELADEKCSCGYVFKARRKPLKTVDGELELVTEAKPVTEEEKRRRYEWFLTQQYTEKKKNGDAFAPNYAVMKFRSIFGSNPKRGWREEWIGKRINASHDRQISTFSGDLGIFPVMEGVPTEYLSIEHLVNEYDAMAKEKHWALVMTDQEFINAIHRAGFKPESSRDLSRIGVHFHPYSQYRKPAELNSVSQHA